ncbi:hypothetical protein [Rhizobium sp. RCC_161_2]|uniref:hypothetical protein n=1 Tax=Rhizobium sp. RCC_161_2 TaxID=3239219 RepID=UPI003524DFB6
MQSVFVAGSITIKNLPTAFVEKLDSLLAANLGVLVGDASGTDKAVQEVLRDRGAESVTVYCSGSHPRNNLGDWPVRHASSDAEPGTKAFFAAKDILMAENADVGLMLWDAKSTGTLSNVIELTRRRKKSVVFVNKRGGFTIIRDIPSLRNLVELMSVGARELAEKKIRLSIKLNELDNEQLGFSF